MSDEHSLRANDGKQWITSRRKNPRLGHPPHLLPVVTEH
jgi:hypothetical protein